MTGFVIKKLSTVLNAKSLRECSYYIVLVVQALVFCPNEIYWKFLLHVFGFIILDSLLTV